MSSDIMEPLHEGDARSGSASASDANATDDNKSKQTQINTEDTNKLLSDGHLTEDVTCGFWLLKGKFFQRFANQTAYVILYGLAGCIVQMSQSYFNGTITSMERRFKIPSQNTGIIMIGKDISQAILAVFVSYYAGKGHRPRWIGFGLLTILVYCLLTATPHLIYGPGDDALAMTSEHGAIIDGNATTDVVEEQLCGNGVKCEQGVGNLTAQILFFIALLMSGIGGSLYWTLGVAYMDDNTNKEKSPLFFSLSYFLTMLGPALGYALASFCLHIFVAPELHPVINNKDPRWLGAWWMGWFILSGILFICGLFLSMFPRQLPKAAAHRLAEERSENDRSENENTTIEEAQASLMDMLQTLKRLITNKTYIFNNLAAVFYFFGYAPYLSLTPKYIEIQFRQSASASSLVTSVVALAATAIGVLLSGFILSKYQPRARYMAAWNIVVAALTAVGIFTYAFIGCPGNEKSVVVNIPDSANNTPTCNSACNCDYVRYSPVCGEDNMTYISPCHAGCKKQNLNNAGQLEFFDCACIPSGNLTIEPNRMVKLLNDMDRKNTAFELDASKKSSIEDTSTTRFDALLLPNKDNVLSGQAIHGACPVNCYTQFIAFLVVMGFLQFLGSTGRTANFLVSVRSVLEKDKNVAMGVGLLMMSLLTFIPSPIFFGWILDRLCLVWGKTCTNNGNCWLYDPKALRYTLNLTAAAFITIGALLNCLVWFYVKNLKIFDDEVQSDEKNIIEHEGDENSEHKMET